MFGTISGTFYTPSPLSAARLPLDRGRPQPHFVVAFRPAAFPLDPHIGPHPRSQRTAGASRTISGTLCALDPRSVVAPTSGAAPLPASAPFTYSAQNCPNRRLLKKIPPLNQLPVHGPPAGPRPPGRPTRRPKPFISWRHSGRWRYNLLLRSAGRPLPGRTGRPTTGESRSYLPPELRSHGRERKDE